MGEGAAERSNREWLDSVYDRLLVKMKAECDRVGTDIPYSPGEDGLYHDVADIANWTNGFWPGMLWQMYEATGDEAYRSAAVGVEERLKVVLEDPEALGHDLGFMFLQSSVANYRRTGDAGARCRGLLAAAEVASRSVVHGPKSWAALSN